ncbi:hypothetical protein MXB_2493 [Myxobolus squamalis]|nr:hypothetical protein MXB_2493 [Myxobolus squamalis]
MLIIIFILIFTFEVIDLRVEQVCLNKEWEEHKSIYNLHFSLDEEVYRKEIFGKNYQFILKSNSRNLNFTLKMNKFGHLKRNERPRLLNLKKPLGHYEDEDPIFVTEPIPSNYDWRQKGVVSAVHNQLQCTSCYAYSAVGAIESHFAIQSGILRELSVQEIIDCSDSYGNLGCDGGFPESIYEYVWDNGLSLESDYSYTARHEHCQRNNPNSSYKLSGYRGLKGGDEDNLLRALFVFGPIPIAIDSEHDEFDFYHSGIINIPNCNPENLDHAVLAVGYNLTETPYLLVKNSFGTNWGIGGYFKIALYEDNMCGISSWATLPYITF